MMEDKQKTETDFIGLIEQHKRIIYKVCYIYAHTADGLSDLYQEVVVNLWKGYSRFRGDSKASTWVYRIALNTCVSFLRKSKSRPETIPLKVNMDFFDDDERATQTTELYELINELLPFDRALILLWLEEKNYEEIAEIIGISKANVAVRLNRIREKLRKMSDSLK